MFRAWCRGARCCGVCVILVVVCCRCFADDLIAIAG